ncbi:MAG: nucleotidyl transferase AbiEii/AbiGii toxin family protein, partial [Desulfobacterales bacterium]
MPEAFYSDKLYPFMDRILSLIRKADTTFYLTGGTALGRHYLHHRYSDDLDLFDNQAGDFREQVKKTLELLRHSGVKFELGTAADTFVRVLAHEGKMPLKIDFTNDVALHYVNYQKASFFPRIDHWRDILSNKLCTLSRREPKDPADIIFLAKGFQSTWPEIFD